MLQDSITTSAPDIVGGLSSVVPLKCKSAFAAIRNVPMLAFFPVHKRNDAGRLQQRYVIVTTGVVYLADTDGAIKRSFPLETISEVFCDIEHQLVVIMCPEFYDMAVFMDNRGQETGLGPGSPAGSPHGAGSPTMKPRSSFKAPWKSSAKRKAAAAEGEAPRTALDEIIPGGGGSGNNSNNLTPSSSFAQQADRSLNATTSSVGNESIVSTDATTLPQLTRPPPDAVGLMINTIPDEDLPLLAVALRDAYNALPSSKKALRITTALDYAGQQLPNFVLKRPQGLYIPTFGLMVESRQVYREKARARRSVFGDQNAPQPSDSGVFDPTQNAQGAESTRSAVGELFEDMGFSRKVDEEGGEGRRGRRGMSYFEPSAENGDEDDGDENKKEQNDGDEEAAPKKRVGFRGVPDDAPTGAPSRSGPPRMRDARTTVLWQRRLVLFFIKYDPEKVGITEQMLAKCKSGREDDFMAALVKRYGPEEPDPGMDPDAAKRMKRIVRRFYRKYDAKMLNGPKVNMLVYKYCGAGEQHVFSAMEQRYGEHPAALPIDMDAEEEDVSDVELPAEGESAAPQREQVKSSGSAVALPPAAGGAVSPSSGGVRWATSSQGVTGAPAITLTPSPVPAHRAPSTDSAMQTDPMIELTPTPQPSERPSRFQPVVLTPSPGSAIRDDLWGSGPRRSATPPARFPARVPQAASASPSAAAFDRPSQQQQRPQPDASAEPEILALVDTSLAFSPNRSTSQASSTSRPSPLQNTQPPPPRDDTLDREMRGVVAEQQRDRAESDGNFWRTQAELAREENGILRDRLATMELEILWLRQRFLQRDRSGGAAGEEPGRNEANIPDFGPSSPGRPPVVDSEESSLLLSTQQSTFYVQDGDMAPLEDELGTGSGHPLVLPGVFDLRPHTPPDAGKDERAVTVSPDDL